MSSHHIVRDQQEPALIIQQIELFPISILHSLLEWLPTVICIENSIEKYTIYGHKLDIALVSFENLKFWERSLQSQQPVEVLNVKMDCAVQKSIKLLTERGHRAINIITTENSLSNVIEELKKWFDKLDLVVYTESKRYVIQKTSVFQKWVPSDSELWIRSLSSNSYVTTFGFDEDLKSKSLNGTFHLKHSNEGRIAIQCLGTPYMVIENL
jgi:hypothetical protein